METLKPENLLLTERGRAWLDGFDPADREAARRLVSSLTLVSFMAFGRTIEQIVRSEADNIAGPVALFAVREIDPARSYFEQAAGGRGRKRKSRDVDAVGRGSDIGSEGHVASTLRNIAKSEPEKFLTHPTVSEMRKVKCRAIIVVDDLIGTGKRTREFLDSIWADRTICSWWSLGHIQFKVVAFAGTRGGGRRVQRAKYKPTIEMNRDCPTFSRLPRSVIHRREISQLCQTYATRTCKPNMALGYHNTMVSLIFEHGCPNNVPAILWAPSAKGQMWQPLFPSRSVHQEEQSIFPPEIARQDPISILLAAGQPRLARTGLLSVDDAEAKQTLTVLALIAKGIRRNDALTYATGLSNGDVEELLGRCAKWGFVNFTRRITVHGLAELKHARRSGRIDSVIPDRGDDNYHPQMLRGPVGG